MHEERKRTLKGNGTRESPFIIDERDYVTSATVQDCLLELFFRADSALLKNAIRIYEASPRGELGNKDLCKTTINIHGKILDVWFDLADVTRNIHTGITKAAKVQVVVDHSPPDMVPLAELDTLNQIRAKLDLPPLSPISTQTSSYENYGRVTSNPILVAGITGLVVYVRSLRLIALGDLIELRAHHLWSAKFKDHPVDCFQIKVGESSVELIFCIYGERNDAINPQDFRRVPFDGVFNFRLDSFLSTDGSREILNPNGRSIALVERERVSMPDNLSPSEVDLAGELIVHMGLYSRVHSEAYSNATTDPSLASRSRPNKPPVLSLSAPTHGSSNIPPLLHGAQSSPFFPEIAAKVTTAKRANSKAGCAVFLLLAILPFIIILIILLR